MRVEGKISPELLVEWERNPADMEARFTAAFLDRLKEEMRGRAETIAARMAHGSSERRPKGLMSSEVAKRRKG